MFGCKVRTVSQDLSKLDKSGAQVFDDNADTLRTGRQLPALGIEYPTEPAVKEPILEYMFQEYQDDREKPESITKKTPELEYPHSDWFGLMIA